ncbi:MAG: hypothetical protein EB133_01360 [Betaproteobacteria bacterium]|nr:hypothetical protein [Betaproteobacteria bacterium]
MGKPVAQRLEITKTPDASGRDETARLRFLPSLSAAGIEHAVHAWLFTRFCLRSVPDSRLSSIRPSPDDAHVAAQTYLNFRHD